MLPSVRPTSDAAGLRWRDLSSEHSGLRGAHLIASSPLIGRQAAKRAVIRALEASALVTLTGAGGVGKSRLALAVAEEVEDRFADGIWWVDLSPLPVDGEVEDAILSVFNSIDHSPGPSESRLVDVLRDRQALIVLDNCEHVLRRVAGLTARLLAETRRVTILATSREGLGSLQERVLPLEPLALPPEEADRGALNASTYESVALFVQRASAVRPDFELDDANVADVVSICRDLEGWPLAIELAASRVRSLSLSQIRDELTDSMAVLRTRDPLAPPRHQSLRAVTEWSWRLCDERERMMWRRASVFPATGFDLEAARMVCADLQLPIADTWEVLDHLVSKSILLASPQGAGMRYRFLDTIRRYGQEQLAAARETEIFRRRHRDYCLMLAADAFREWDTPRQRESIDLLRRNRESLLRAMEWSFSTPGEASPGLEIAWRMTYHWAIDGSLRDGRRWLQRALAAAPPTDPGRPMALWALTWVTLLQGDAVAADEALDLMEREGSLSDDSLLAARHRVFRGFVELRSDRIAEAIESLGGAASEFAASEDVGGFVFTSMLLTLALAQAGDFAQAEAVVLHAVSASEGRGERWGRAQVWWALGYSRWRQGDDVGAVELVRRGLAEGLEFDRVGLLLRLETLAWIAASRREYDRAARLRGAVGAMWQELGATIGAHGMYADRHSRHCLAVLERSLSPARLEALTREGADMELARVIRYAVGQEDVDGRVPLDPRLTRREQEIAALLGRGAGTREIAAALSLSARTVEGHIGRAMGKLHFESRAQLAAWAAGSR